ncbi:MAG: transcription-repair coupling factor [Verrucomicrobiota bacterium]
MAAKPKASETHSTQQLLDRLAGGENYVQATTFEHIAPPAQPFVAALAIEKNPANRVWILCPHVRVQERIHHDLRVWGCDSRYFPEVEFSGFEDALPDPDIGAERLGILHDLGEDQKQVIVLCEDSLDDTVATLGSLRKDQLEFEVGGRIDLKELGEQLEKNGYERLPQVFQRGQFAIRGGIVDVFSWQGAVPIRIELFDDEIESLREFDIDEQTSIGRIEKATLLLNASSGKSKHCDLRDYIKSDDLIITVDCEKEVAVTSRRRITIASTAAAEVEKEEDFSLACFENPIGAFAAGDFILQEAKRAQFFSQMREWIEDDWLVAMFFNTRGELERFTDLVDDEFIESGAIQPFFGRLEHGFTVPTVKLAVLADAEIFGRYQNLRARRLANRRMKMRRVSGESDLRNFEEDDIVVHQGHGVGRFQEIVEKDGQEVLVIEYADKAKLYVPVDQAHLVSRYVGVGKAAPKLSKLGSTRWSNTRDKAEKSILDYAAQLLKLQAERATSKAYAHAADNKWQWEFENSFLYTETPDQLTAIEETKRDMEAPEPMDRLICGDVGFGKTEVAIRAVFKAVMSGMQVAVLTPTTVLAQQHYNTFRERMSDYPVTIDLLSRYRTPGQQRKTVVGVMNGSVDVVIGTHRLISKDVSYKNLGLVVIDEEQRFGVKHKERFKEMFSMVDVLTLSATPIPRTLYLSLMGVRDMSTIDTPPMNRIPVGTSICPYDERIIRKSIDRELKRKGQVFFLHNRVKTIHKYKQMIESLCPDARVEIGHGQMDEGALEDVMNRFVRGDFDVLVSTTIIESGIDIPNANTIIIDRADRFGLADLYQLRGRVGRSQTKAYAILMLPRDMMTGGDARKRVSAIKQYTALGSGFKIAMRDLEIRGAGNLLGTQQSGHIAAVGFDLYCRLLKQSVAKLRGERVVKQIDVTVDLDFVCFNEAEHDPARQLPAFIPSSYMEEARQRISSYRELAEVSSIKELGSIIKNWEDRFGRKPDAVDNLLRCTELKLRCAGKRVTACEVKENKLILTRGGRGIQVDGKYPRLQEWKLKELLLEVVEKVKAL